MWGCSSQGSAGKGSESSTAHKDALPWHGSRPPGPASCGCFWKGCARTAAGWSPGNWLQRWSHQWGPQVHKVLELTGGIYSYCLSEEWGNEKLNGGYWGLNNLSNTGTMLTILFSQLWNFTLITLTVKNSHSRAWLKSIDSEHFLFLNSFIKWMCFELDPLHDLLMHFFKV